MSDLSELQASQSVKIAGATGSGSETFYADVDSNNNLKVVVNNSTGASAVNIQDGGNSLTIDSPQFPASLGQTTMANSLAVVLASNQSAIPVSQSGTWTTGRTWTLSSGTDSVSSVQSGTWNINNISGTISLPTGASTSVLQTSGNASLTSIDGKTPALGQALAASSVPVVLTASQLTTLTPLSTIAVTQSTNPWVVSGTVAATQSGTWSTGRTWTLGSGADSVSSVQSGVWSTRTQDGAGTALTSTLITGKQSLDVNIANVLTTGLADKSTYTYGTTFFQPTGGVFQDTSATLTAGQSGSLRLSGERGLHVNFRNASGTEIGTSTNPISVFANSSDFAPATQNITAQDVGSSSGVGANGQTLYFGSPTANSVASFALASYGNVVITTSYLGGSGSVSVEVSADGGTFWTRPAIFQPGTQNNSNSFSTNFQVTLNVTGMTNVRVRSTSAWTGTATITLKASVNNRNMTVVDPLPTGTNSIGSIAQSGAWTTGRTWTLASGTDSISAVQSGTWNINNISGTVSLPTGASTAANQTAEITSLQLIDDAVNAPNTAVSKGVPIMGQMDDTSTVIATEDNVSVTRITAQRALHINLRTSGGVEIGAVNAQLKVADLINDNDGTQSALSVGTTAVEIKVGSSRLANRKAVTLCNNSVNIVYWGYSSGVTTSSGTPIYPRDFFGWDIGDSQSIYAIAASAANDTRITEA